jgi:hypothetical protein
MKRLLISLAVLCLSATVATADSGWGFFGSYWSPSDGEASFGPGLQLSFETIPGVQFNLRLSYFDDVMDKDDGPELEVIPVEAGLGLVAPIVDRLNAYGGIGAGYYFMDSDADVDDEVGFFVHGGLSYDVARDKKVYGGSRASLFVEAMYRSVTADDAAYSGDVDLDGLVLNGGLMVRW